MSERLGIDYAWQKPSARAIRQAGYTDVFRYLSHDASKNLDAAERDALHAQGLRIHLVWESTASRASQGFQAGLSDGHEANRQADALGHPKNEPLFYAVDFDGNPAQVRNYFRGVRAAGGRTPGDYGGIKITEGGLTGLHWQTCAWSGGRVSQHAHVYQRQKPTKSIAGTRGGFDENVVIGNLTGWGPKQAVQGFRNPPASRSNPARRPLAPTRVGLAQKLLVQAHSYAVKKGWKRRAAALAKKIQTGPNR